MTDSARLFHNGVNLQPSYYNDGEVTFGWDLMRAADKIKTLRIEIEPKQAVQARSWISASCSGAQHWASASGTEPGSSQETPAALHTCWLQRQVGFSTTRA